MWALLLSTEALSLASLILPHAARDAYRELRASLESTRGCSQRRRKRRPDLVGDEKGERSAASRLRVPLYPPIRDWSDGQLLWEHWSSPCPPSVVMQYCRNASSGPRRYSGPVFAETRLAAEVHDRLFSRSAPSIAGSRRLDTECSSRSRSPIQRTRCTAIR